MLWWRCPRCSRSMSPPDLRIMFQDTPHLRVRAAVPHYAPSCCVSCHSFRTHVIPPQELEMCLLCCVSAGWAVPCALDARSDLSSPKKPIQNKCMPHLFFGPYGGSLGPSLGHTGAHQRALTPESRAWRQHHDPPHGQQSKEALP